MPPKAATPDPKAPKAAAKTLEVSQETIGNTQTLPEVLPKAGKTVKVKFLRSHPALAYSAGEEADLPQELFDKYQPDGPFFEKI